MKAFPNHRSEGMDLRDYFAIKILQGFVIDACPTWNKELREKEDSQYSIRAYKLADAMMEERKKHAKPE